MKNIIKPAFILALIAFLSAFVLSYARKITYPYIIKQEIDKQNRAIELVLPDCKISEENIADLGNGEKFSYWIGTQTVDGVEKKGFAFISVNYGYSGDIKAMVGVNEENKILGISIIQQTETPGLGARVLEKASKESIWGVMLGRNYSSEEVTEPWFQEQFRGIDLNKKITILKKGLWSKELSAELLSQNAITAITGATVTTKAIANGLKDSLIKLKKARLILEPAVEDSVK